MSWLVRLKLKMTVALTACANHMTALSATSVICCKYCLGCAWVGLPSDLVMHDVSISIQLTLSLPVCCTATQVTNLEQRLHLVEEDNESLSSKFDESRRAAESAARQWAAQLDALAAAPRDKWPRAVLSLVEDVERRVQAEAAAKIAAGAEA